MEEVGVNSLEDKLEKLDECIDKETVVQLINKMVPLQNSEKM